MTLEWQSQNVVLFESDFPYRQGKKFSPEKKCNYNAPLADTSNISA